MSVIGIDLGNTDCVLAQAKRGGIDVLINENSNRKNPNMVSFNGKHRLMGESAAAVARTNFRNTATNIKLLIGRLYQDPIVQNEIKTLPFTCLELPNGFVGIEVLYNEQKTIFTCEQLLAMILTKLDNIATIQNDGIKSSYCVLSVPGYFTDLQRRSVLNACQIANISCLRILNEHTAIALGYGIYKSARNLFDNEKPTNVMFLDIGNTTYTVSIVAFVQGKLQVKSVAYDINLGGRDFDMAIGKYIAQKFSEKYKGLNPLEDAKARMKLLSACEKTKKNLSPQGVTLAPINIECLMDEKDFNGRLELEEFEKIIAPLLDRLQKPIDDALAEAKLQKSDLTDIEIVGGGTRISSLKKRLSEILGLDASKPNMGLSTTLNADEAVARGCALQCAILSPLFKVKEFDVRDINSFPIEVSWEKEQGAGAQAANEVDDDNDAIMSGNDAKETSLVIMTRKDDFPKTKKINFKRFNDFKIQANYSTEDSPYLSTHTPKQIGEFQVTGITSLQKQQEAKSEEAAQEGARVTIYMRQDINGLFYVSSGHLMQEILEEEVQPASEQGESKVAEGAEKDQSKQENENEMKDAEDSKDGKPATEEPKKKRFRRVDLSIVSSVNGLSQTEIQQAIEKEVAMANQDRVIEETSNKRNELESYIYEMRDSVGSKYRDVITEADRKVFEAKLEETENWLYDEGFDCMKSVYQEKLNALLQHGDPLAYRLTESQNRPAVIARFNQTIEDILRQANSQEPSNEHWTSADRDTLRNACQQKQQWLYQQIENQSKCAMTENPKVTCQMLQTEMNNLTKECSVVLNKPKPKPEPVKEEVKKEEPKKSEEETKKEDGKASDNNSTEKMELD